MHAGAMVTGGLDGKMVNLSVQCDEDVAHLKWSSGGLEVTSTRIYQKCVAQDESNTSKVYWTCMP